MHIQNAAVGCALLLVLKFAMGCAAPSQNLSGIEDTQGRWARGSSTGGCYFALNAIDRQRMIHEINDLPLGSSVAETVARLGKADLAYQEGEKTPRTLATSTTSLFYSFKQKYSNRTDKGDDEQVELYFLNDKLVSVRSAVDEIASRPAPDIQYTDASDEKVVIVGTYASPQWSEENGKNHDDIKRLMRSENIAYETWPMGKVFQILVSRSDAERAQRVLCRAVREGRIVGKINGCP